MTTQDTQDPAAQADETQDDGAMTTAEERERRSQNQTTAFTPDEAEARLETLLDLHARGAVVHELHRTGPDGTCHCPKGRRCTGPGKHPKRTGWEQSDGLSAADIVTLTESGAPFGVRTGDLRDGGVLFVIDIDGPGGEASWARLIAENGDLPATFTVATPSGGRHLYFTAPAGTRIPNSASRIAPAVDVRGHGGQVVAPGTFIRNYRDTGRTGAYSVIDAAPFAEGGLR